MSITDNALKLLCHKAYTEKQLKDKLTKNFSEIEINDCLDKLKKWGYVNDRQFGITRLHQLQERLKSRSYVIMDLEQQGLNKHLVKDLMETYYPETIEIVIAEKIINKKLNPNKGSKTKIWVSLIRAGFSENTVHHCFPGIDPT